MNTTPIDPKKRLEEILKNYIIPRDDYGIDYELQKEDIKDCKQEILKEFVHKDNTKDICSHGKRIGHQYCRECSLKMIEEEYDHENEIFDQRAKDRGYVRKDILPNFEEIANSLYYDCPKKYKNSNLALCAWQSALDKLAKAIRKLIEGKK